MLNNKLDIKTLIVIIALIILAMYAFTEVTYFSSKIVIERNIESPVLTIPQLGVQEKINNVSISQGVYKEEQSNTPTHGEVILFGHRTLQGSPFLRLNELKPGDIITLDWPGIGEANYTVNSTKIVPASYKMQVSNTLQKIDLITCNPIGSTSERLIVSGDLTSVGELNHTILKENPQKDYGLYICIIFLALGLLFTYFYPKEYRMIILILILILSAILFYYNFFPISSQIMANKLGWLNSFYNF
ncbi:class E sortase [Methanobrevibacter acididurans]|jgi:sortase A|uniref:class E sortase n=1 Tax=Methanobrevibacter acididurans TaxID=120963 RepID=UPI0038FCB63B